MTSPTPAGGSPPTSPSASPGGEAWALGWMLLEIRNDQRHLAATLERLREMLHDLPERLADAIPAHPPPPCAVKPKREPLGWRDWVTLTVLAGTVLGVLLGKISAQEAIGIAGKPFGF